MRTRGWSGSQKGVLPKDLNVYSRKGVSNIFQLFPRERRFGGLLRFSGGVVAFANAFSFYRLAVITGSYKSEGLEARCKSQESAPSLLTLNHLSVALPG